jgi:hypothetical protein
MDDPCEVYLRQRIHLVIERPVREYSLPRSVRVWCPMRLGTDPLLFRCILGESALRQRRLKRNTGGRALISVANGMVRRMAQFRRSTCNLRGRVRSVRPSPWDTGSVAPGHNGV